ncbi:TetR family transcriptional regulator [Pseudonocardia hierapolitana]|uniref:TetR family transcriptional regulator n=2 Tax=Pseudonocardia hierapolitana TaxID=1128676 RepID=A0A561SWJ2_9PSEU|nr:TetR family transcriptional regulator [Pseudonocardia hierapolitana]
MAPDDRRAAIVDAARPLVMRHGAGVTTRQIAEAAGIAEGTIFRVFPDKDSVVQAVVAEVFDPEPTLRELAAVDRGLPLRERLTRATDVLQRRLSQVFGLLDALGWIRPPDPEEHRPQPPAAINDAFRAAVVDIVGADERRLRVPATELAHVLRLLVFSGTHPMISDGRPLTPEQIVTILLDGLYLPTPPAPQAPPASAPRFTPTTTEDRAC